jgi:DNA polymerase-1
MLNKIVQRFSDLPNLASAERIVLDSETSGTSLYHGDRITGVAVGPYDEDLNFYIPLRHTRLDPGTVNLDPTQVFNWLRDLTKDLSKKFYFQNAKYDLAAFRFDQVEFPGPIVDTMIFAHVLDGDRWSYDLETLVKEYVPEFDLSYVAKFHEYLERTQPCSKTEAGKVEFNYSLAPPSMLGEYACWDIQATRELAKALRKFPTWERIPNQGNMSWNRNQLLTNEFELIKVLFEMEWAGVKINKEKCAVLRDNALDEMQIYSDKMGKLAGKSFAPTKWTQLNDAFERAGGEIKFWNLPQEQRGKQKLDQFTEDMANSTGRPCWNAIALLKYMEFYKPTNPKVFEFLVAYREYSQRARIISTNLDVYLRGCDTNGRLHGQFHQHRTITGRLSSSEPNLENIAKVKGTADQGVIEKLIGKKDHEALNRQLRSVFIAKPGNAFVSIDYSQIEYRGAAYFAEDEVLLEKYRQDPKTDYHQYTADLAGIDRDRAKTVNFGTLYGMGAASLASLLLISEGEAKAILQQVFNARPKLKTLIDTVGKLAERFKEVQNPFGRVCPVSPGFSYKAINYLVQGHVGDMLRWALVRLFKEIKAQSWPVTLMLPEHDEICSEMPWDLVPEFAPKFAKVMCECPMMPTIPILADVEAGPNWGKELLPLEDFKKLLQSQKQSVMSNR